MNPRARLCLSGVLAAVVALVISDAPVACAGLDPDPDSMGIYFDATGNSNCLWNGPFAPFSAYLLLSNPAGPTSGFACRVSLEGAPYFLLSTDLGDAMDIDSSAEGFLVEATSPYPEIGSQIVLATFSVMLQSPSVLDFFVRPPVPPYGTCPGPVVFGDGGTRCCGVSSGNVDLPVATVNGNCGVADESSSFGAIKSLYR